MKRMQPPTFFRALALCRTTCGSFLKLGFSDLLATTYADMITVILK